MSWTCSSREQWYCWSCPSPNPSDASSFSTRVRGRPPRRLHPRKGVGGTTTDGPLESEGEDLTPTSPHVSRPRLSIQFKVFLEYTTSLSKVPRSLGLPPERKGQS